MAAGRLRQARLMLWKNWLFSVRSWKSTLLQLLTPLLALLLVTGLSYLPQGLENVPYPQASRLGTLPKCKSWNGKECVSLIVMAVNKETPFLLNISTATRKCIENTMSQFSTMTGLDLTTDIQLFLTVEAVKKLLNWRHISDNYFTAHPNQTQAAVLFLNCHIDENSPSESRLSYTILYNSTRAIPFQQIIFGSPNKPDGRNEIAILLDSIFLSLVTKMPVDIAVQAAPFPQFYQQESVPSKQSATATTFIFCAITFQFLMMLYNVVSEKDLKLRQGLKLIGLKDSVYWIAWTVTGLVIALLSTLILLVTGYACQLQFFLNTDPVIAFLLFFIYSASMVPLAFFASVFLGTVRQAVNTGMLVFVIGLMVISLLSNPFLLTEMYHYVKPLVAILTFLPPFHLAKVMADIGIAGSDTDASGLPQSSYHFGWKQLFMERKVIIFDENPHINSTTSLIHLPPTYESFIYLVCDAVFYGLLAWYLDAVIRGNHGIPRKLYFPFQLSYWLDGFRNRSDQSRQGEEVVQGIQAHSNESTPLLRRVNVSRAEETGGGRPYDITQNRDALEIHGLRKVFNTGCFCYKGRTNVAVDGLSLRVADSQILALLGHNGAGKSTTINMLTGLMEPDKGSAYFYRLSVTSDLDEIRSMLGVCPQHDVLWGDLTAREHMSLFAHLKNIPRGQMEDEIEGLLEDVQLNHVADHRVNTFSGGMKRRLSVALSFLGDPKIMFLDEPTTGMDPRIRRDIWNLILRRKQSRVTVMTTHAMEEADILGDTIAIMAGGQLRVMGTSVSLKNRFAGYNIELVVRKDSLKDIKHLVQTKLPGASLKTEPQEVENGVLLAYNLPPDRHSEIVPFFSVIEGQGVGPGKGAGSGQVLDYSISQTTLEEVFMNVTVGELFKDQDYQPALLRSHSCPSHPSCPSKERSPSPSKPLADLSQ